MEKVKVLLIAMGSDVCSKHPYTMLGVVIETAEFPGYFVIWVAQNSN